MSDLLQIARAQLLEPAGLDDARLDRLMGRLSSNAIDLGELFFQHHRVESWSLEDGIVKDGSFSVDRGVGVRAVSGEKTGFAYAEDIQLSGLENATEAARSIARQGQERQVRAWRPVVAEPRYVPEDPIASLSDSEKVALLRAVDEEARHHDPRVKEVNVRLTASHETILVMATDGALAADVRPLVRLDVSVIVEQAGQRERGSAGGGGRHDLSVVADQVFAFELAREAVRMALVNLEADPAPAGPMTVVLGSGWPGVLLHEAVGHVVHIELKVRKHS